MDYLHWAEKIVTDLSDEIVAKMYDEGFLFTRLSKGTMHQTRLARINLADFELTSENRRILKKTPNLSLVAIKIPEELEGLYDWRIHKMAHDFYKEKFGEKVFSANKIRSLLLHKPLSNFNRLFTYKDSLPGKKGLNEIIGYAICYENSQLLHYSYPFYDLKKSSKDMGLGMMIRAIEYAKKSGKKYIYLGSLQRKKDVYKLQFKGLEWFDGKNWRRDVEEAKRILLNNPSSAKASEGEAITKIQ